jgi:pimeloyl-ACP methyl ester carboxylesterase
VDALGSFGPELELVLQGLNSAGQPLRTSGSNRAPARLASSQTRQQLGDTNGSSFPTFLRATQMSPNPGSSLHNVYLAGPITLTGRSFSSAQISSIQGQLARTVVTAGRALWIGLDPVLNVDPYPASIRSSVVQQKLVAGASVYAQVNSPPLPLILVPGVAGSHLTKIGTFIDRELWPGFTDIGKTGLTLNPADTQEQIVVRDIVRVAPEPYEFPSRFSPIGCLAAPIYQPLIGHLTEQLGMREYDYLKPASGLLSFLPCLLGTSQTVQNSPEQSATNRTVNGADYAQIDNEPNLFTFPYDWRRSNVTAVAQLKEYVEVVKRFHPEAEQVDILAHSMGGLVSRRFILDNPGAVNRLITLGSPWLGAPKAINALETGDFLDFIQHLLVIKKSTLKELAEFFHGPQELVPSPAYFTLAGPPFVDLAGDLPGSAPGVGGGPLSFAQFKQVMDDVYHTNVLVTPAAVSQAFHEYDVPGVGKQDDWRIDNTGVEYFHILGIQSAANTIGKVTSRLRIRPRPDDPVKLFEFKREFAIEYTRGDGTVPIFSSLRINGGQNLNAPNAQIYQLLSPGPGGDKLTDHNGMLANPELLDLVGRILDGDVPPTNAPATSGHVTHLVRFVNAEKNELVVSRSSSPAITTKPELIGNVLFGVFGELFLSREEEIPGLEIEEPATNIVDAVLEGPFEVKADYDGRPVSLRVETLVDGVPQRAHIWHSIDPTDAVTSTNVPAPIDFGLAAQIPSDAGSAPKLILTAGATQLELPFDEVGPANPPAPTLSYYYTNNCRAIAFVVQGTANTNITRLYIGGPPADTNQTEVLHLFTNNVIPVTNLLAIAVSNRIDVFAEAGEVPSGALTIDIVGIDLTLDAAGTIPLSDWGVTNQKPRSARFVFNKDDQVFVKVRSRANFGDNHFRVHVYSESDTNGVVIKLQEISSGVYQNLLSSEVLNFEQFDPNSPGTAVGIKDEELVTFELMDPQGAKIAECDLMVDLGEIALATLEHSDRSDTAKPRFDFRDQFLTAGNGFRWSSAGVQLQFPDEVAFLSSSGTNNEMGRMITDFRDPPLTNVGQADFLYVHAHGNAEGKLFDHLCKILTNLPCSEIISPAQFQPTLSSVWNKDADFFLLDACLTLNEGIDENGQPIQGIIPGKDSWALVMSLSSRPLHGILGFFLPKTPRLRVEYVDFMQRMKNGAAIPDAFQAAMEVSSQGALPWAYLWYDSQLTDTIRRLNQDERGAAPIRYRNARGTNVVFSCEDQAAQRAGPLPLSNQLFGRIYADIDALNRIGPAPTVPQSLGLEAQARPAQGLAETNALGKLKMRAGREEFEPDESQAPVQTAPQTIENAVSTAWQYLARNSYNNQNLRLVDVGELRSQLITITNPTSVLPKSELEAYVISFNQIVAGLPVDRSSLRVEVAEGRVRRMTRDGFVNETVIPAGTPQRALGAVNALTQAAPRLNSSFIQSDEMIVTEAALVWTSEEPPVDLLVQNARPAKLVPAWRCLIRRAKDGEVTGRAMINALTGEVLEGER